MQKAVRKKDLKVVQRPTTLRETLEWRNREGVRQNFKHSAVLEWEQHHRWFLHYSEKPDDIVFIVHTDQALPGDGAAGDFGDITDQDRDSITLGNQNPADVLRRL